MVVVQKKNPGKGVYTISKFSWKNHHELYKVGMYALLLIRTIKHYLTRFQVRPRLDVNLAASTGNTPLHAAANNGNVEMAAILLGEKGIKVNAKVPDEVTVEVELEIESDESSLEVEISW